MPKTNNTTTAPISQATASLRQLADGLQHGELDPRWQVDKIARILASALGNIEERLTTIEQCEANPIWVAGFDDDLLRPSTGVIDWNSGKITLTHAEPAKKPRFATLVDLLADCPECSHEHEVLPPTARDARYYARCSNPQCDLNYIIYPISPALAESWESAMQAEDMAYQAGEEEASDNGD